MPRPLDGRGQGRERELIEVWERVLVLREEVREGVFGVLKVGKCWEVWQRGELFAEGVEVVHKWLEEMALLVSFVLEHGSVLESVWFYLGEEERGPSLWVVFRRIRVARGRRLLVFNEGLYCAVEVSVFETGLFHCPFGIRTLLLYSCLQLTCTFSAMYSQWTSCSFVCARGAAQRL